MPSDDLAQHATSSHDFYALLGVTSTTPESDIRRAYRKTALKYHPDKNADNPAAVETFHLLQIAYDVLSDPAAKVAYDNARAARVQKQRQDDLLQGRRRQMKEDLEMRERGFKRKRDEEVDAEEALAREIRRLAEDGKRRRREREEKLRRDQLEEEERLDQRLHGNGDNTVSSGGDSNAPPPAQQGGTTVPEIDRTIKVRWIRDESGPGSTIDKDRLTTLFSTFGPVENAFLLKDKKTRVGERREKKIMATGVVVFASIVGAHAAVEDVKKQPGDIWRVFESVFWAAGKEPDLAVFGMFGGAAEKEDGGAQRQRQQQQHQHEQRRPGSSSPPLNTSSSIFSTPATPSTPLPSSKKRGHQFPGLNTTPSTPFTPPTANNNSDNDSSNNNPLKRVPSFASFSSATFSTPKRDSPFGKTQPFSTGSPSLEEITLIRLKNAEKRRLEEEIRRQDASVEATAEGAD
ncbi:MAG: hypothetical protein M1819_000357 [Sarea resinae]|nr:MAG: hypothetical protein M1819_000357 [Sarea resinae]